MTEKQSKTARDFDIVMSLLDKDKELQVMQNPKNREKQKLTENFKTIFKGLKKHE